MYAIGGSICIILLLCMLNYHGYSQHTDSSKYDKYYYKLIEIVSPYRLVILGFVLYIFFQLYTYYYIKMIYSYKQDTRDRIDIDSFTKRHVYMPNISIVLNNLKIQNPYFKNQLFTLDIEDNQAFSRYMDVQYQSLEMFKQRFPEAEDYFINQL